MTLLGYDFPTRVNSFPEVRGALQKIQACVKNIVTGGISGMDSYLNLADTSDVSYLGKAGYFPQVAVGETVLTLFDLFGTANTWTGLQTFNDAIDITNSATSIERSAEGILHFVGNNKIIFESSGAITMEVHASGLGGYIEMLDGASHVRQAWGAGAVQWQVPAGGTVQFSISSSGVTIGTLSGFLKGTAGLVSAVAAITLTTDVTGVLPILNGGTGQTSAVAAFDALAPTTTKGDLIVHNGTDNVRLGVGATPDGYVFTRDAAEPTGVKWAALTPGVSTYIDLTDTSDANYTGKANYFPQVNVGETALTLFNLFGTSNTWTAIQIFNDEIQITDSQTTITRNGAGVFTLKGDNRVDILRGTTTVASFGNRTLTLDDPATSSDHVMDWAVTNSWKFKAQGTTIMTLASTGSTFAGTMVIASLTGLLLGTSGVVSAIAHSTDGFVMTMVAGTPAWAAPAAGATTYIALTDTSDASFTGKAGYFPQVNGGETALTLFNLFGAANTWTAANEWQSHSDVQAVSDPGNPSTNDFRLFVRTNGSNLELVSRGPLGDECVLCTKPNVSVSAELQLNWVE